MEKNKRQQSGMKNEKTAGLKIKQINVGDLTPYEHNSRIHDGEQIAQIVASIREFGFTNPILIDEDKGIIAGHGRLMAALDLGMKTVPCITLSHLNEAQKRAYVMADNQLALNAGWDTDMLKREIEGLVNVDFDIEILGFDPNFLDDLLGGEEKQGQKDFSDGFTPTLQVVCECSNEEEQEAVYDLLNQKGHKCKILSI